MDRVILLISFSLLAGMCRIILR